MNLQLEIQGIHLTLRKLSGLSDRIHSLEVKVGNTTINSLQNRITTLQEDIAKLNNRISRIETMMEVFD